VARAGRSARAIDLASVRWLVMDEFDELLGLSHFADVRSVARLLPKPRSRGRGGGVNAVLVSASMPEAVRSAASRFAPHHRLVQVSAGDSAASSRDTPVVFSRPSCTLRRALAHRRAR
jgi:superfamily II DNA/RNA helicase